MNKKYINEREGQIDFFENYHIPWQENDSILANNTDGLYHGNLLEFKLNINNTGKVLFQAIKYLSRMRIKGESIPARILLIDLNDTKVYEYHSKDYIEYIQTTYIGSASKNNDAFNGNVTPINTYNYSDMVDSDKVKKLLINNKNENDWYIPIDIDEDCIVGWAERYYRENPHATKGDFLGDDSGNVKIKGEIRDPKHFKGLINPYLDETNEKFKYLMDCLNDKLNKKDLGAFYTPLPYCEKASELVMKAIERVPKGNDYIILDRCAGTGNLEASLIGKYDMMGSELISHCVVSTYEYYEYKVLLERIGDKVRNIIPPTESNVKYQNGKVSNADAMSEEYIQNPLIKQYIDDDKCTIIMLENPPYNDTSSIYSIYDNEGNKHRTKNKETYVYNQMAKEKKLFRISNISTVRDYANRFIWSAFKYYLRQDTDSYIVFSPVKYFKSIGLIENPYFRFQQGFLFNRKHFHAGPSAISCVLWSYGLSEKKDKFELTPYDIDKNDNLVKLAKQEVKELFNPFSKYNVKYIGQSKTDVTCNSKGEPVIRQNDTISYNDDNIIGYFCQGSSSYDIGRLAYHNGRGTYITKDNFEFICPLFAAKTFPANNWFEKDFYFTSSDGKNKYTKDNQFLKSCLIYTCLSIKNKCVSFYAPDGNYYRNELCFDNTNGETCASNLLQTYSNIDEDEKTLLSLWNKILLEAKKCKKYDEKLTYGIYQINKELNTFYQKGKGKHKEKIYDYPILNSYLISIKELLKEYYKTHIEDKLFKYELIK